MSPPVRSVSRLLLTSTLVVATLFPGPAAAFCGTYVGSAGESLVNRASHVVVGRHGDETVLTLSMDYAGDAENFALLLPMPVVLNPSDVSTPPAELVEAIRTYGDPRLAAYTCEQALGYTGPSFQTVGCGGVLGCQSYDVSGYPPAGGYGDTGSTVDVLRSFSVDGYELVVLSAEDSGQLWTWLDNNGYAVPDGGRDVLQEYLDANLFFVAVKINLARLRVQDGWLPPLQFRYRSAFFGLPIRIGTISADPSADAEPQEVIVSVLADESLGQAAIANYPEVELTPDCMAEVDDFGAWYEARLSDTLGGEAGWIREHSWPVYSLSNDYHCDPCTPTGDFSYYALSQLGAPPSDNIHLTRLRVRYTPEQANADLVFYFDNKTGQKFQQRYVQYLEDLEFLWPTCDVGWEDEPGTCEELDGHSVVSVGCRGNRGLELGAMAFLGGLVGLRRRAVRS